MMTSKWRGRVALVTGSSAGIGLAIARSLAQLGMVVIGCARNIESIKKLEEEYPNGNGSVHAIRCDVTKESEVLCMFAEIKERFGGIDVCINNAGMCRPCTLLDGETDGWREMMEVNVLGLCVCTREAVKSMRDREVDDGHIVNINSTSGHRVRPKSTQHFYSATKHAVTALTEGLRQKLREIKSHIRITDISPGLVQTEFLIRTFGKETADVEYNKFKPLEASDVAEAVVYALQTPSHVQIHEILLRGTEQPL